MMRPGVPRSPGLAAGTETPPEPHPARLRHEIMTIQRRRFDVEQRTEGSAELSCRAGLIRRRTRSPACRSIAGRRAGARPAEHELSVDRTPRHEHRPEMP